ncbi:MAG: diadenylate cyclase CdaA [Lachnospiraceae bacterium]|jgi:diadenylate cyclase|nr:diadenylate cyclase CdaA [Lachnospiraceae bacterium]MBP5600229.1 diadenylate cyclase CdaA [Lachnospiraceae bacterium]MBQ9862362.1 diadenylate cyclase CdaA [Lachnospiraceae bacterium]MCR4933548.1 diadenylate cyclase CdaA [Lachnospiraceae bacterium]
MGNIVEFLRTTFEKFNMPEFSWTDFVEILVIAFLVYEIFLWIKNTKAYSLLKGIVVIVVFLLIAEFFEMSTILWIANKLFTIAATVIVVVFQPELRKALEQLGRKNFLSSVISFENGSDINGRFSDKTIQEIMRACSEMAKVKTGALIVIEQNNSLMDVERTGITVDAVVSSQLLINIFEHNTPLHDGAVVVRGDRITAATCYLPLSDNLSLSKELGTRHRAGVGISEVTDSLTIIVSEETGRISIAYEGELIRNVDAETFRQKLEMIQNKPETEKKRSFFKGKGGKQA